MVDDHPSASLITDMINFELFFFFLYNVSPVWNCGRQRSLALLWNIQSKAGWALYNVFVSYCMWHINILMYPACKGLISVFVSLYLVS